jgi:8-oxo-dGTP pyrophosphatase MutT (NUDIX family)
MDLPIASSTVVILRDVEDDIEMLMIRRSSQSAVLPGAHVFPGGKLDPLDCDRRNDVDDALSSMAIERLNEPELDPGMALGLYSSAIREVLEECGLLLGVDAVTPETRLEIRRLLASGMSLAQACASHGLRPSLETLHPLSRWITPRLALVKRKRFDTRFFVALAPKQQVAQHDGFESTQVSWLRPGDALRLYGAGEIDLAPPQIMTISQLSFFRNTEAILEKIKRNKPTLVQPEAFEEQGRRYVCYPGDPRHGMSTQVWKGPTRLMTEGGRFFFADSEDGKNSPSLS